MSDKQTRQFKFSNVIGLETTKWLYANLKLVPTMPGDVEVEITGPADQVDLFEFACEDGVLKLNGGKEPEAEVLSFGGDVRGRAIISNVIIGRSGGSHKNLPTITVKLPKAANTKLVGVYGSGDVGAFDGKVEIHWDSVADLTLADLKSLLLANTSVGSVSGGKVDDLPSLVVSGTGGVNFDEVGRPGLMEISVRSVGSVTIGKVHCQSLNVAVSSTGGVDLNGVAVRDDTYIRASSVGAVNIADLHTGSLKAELSGTGNVSVGDGYVARMLTVRCSSMGEFDFGGVAQKADLKSTSMGDIHVTKVVETPLMRRTSMGDIDVDNWS